MSIVKELRTKKSRDNRELLDRAADRIEALENEHWKTLKKIFIDVELLIHANEIQTATGTYYRKELKDSFDILKKLYLAKGTNAPTNTENETEKQSGWISVDEMLPDPYVNCLVALKCGQDIRIDLGERIRCHDTTTNERYYEWLAMMDWEIGYEVTHWMPLPEAPKMKGGE